jgi:hypothetical protein
MIMQIGLNVRMQMKMFRCNKGLVRTQNLRVHLYLVQGYNHSWGTILRTMNKSKPHEEIKFLV